MESMHLTILGSGSAMPTPQRFQTAQLLEMRNKQFLIDCGEGAQNRLIQNGIRATRLNHIFISHLHGDHCFGLMGLISTLGMLGRTADIEIHAQPDLAKLLQPQIDYFCSDFPFAVRFHDFNPHKSAVIYDDRSLTVTTLPLKHRVPATGFLFEEKAGERHLIREMIEAYDIPICQLKEIKAGADFVTPDGQIVPNARLTTPPTPPRRYAYISDTAYTEKIIPYLHGIDCLYHEATFLAADAPRAKATLHSTAAQAATIAQQAQVGKLIIGHYSARHRDTAPYLDEARAIFPNTIAATDGLKIEI
ncbi:MAG: ribonuclease Z [Paludibacteraceae bacterium]